MITIITIITIYIYTAITTMMTIITIMTTIMIGLRLRNNHSNRLGGGTPTPCWSNSACCRFEGLNCVTANPEIPKSQVA